jgi:hypothetical protein
VIRGDDLSAFQKVGTQQLTRKKKKDLGVNLKEKGSCATDNKLGRPETRQKSCVCKCPAQDAETRKELDWQQQQQQKKKKKRK